MTATYPHLPIATTRAASARTAWRNWFAACGLLLCLVRGPDASAGELPQAVQAALAGAQVPPEAMAAYVVEVGATEPRLAAQAETAFNPASLMKLVTTSAALELLGPTYVWTTPVYFGGAVRDGRLDGSLTLQGRGDPKLVTERLWLLLRRVQQAGVREIAGDIVLDRSAFQVSAVDPGAFDGEPYRPYNVQADALLLNFKSVVLQFKPDAARGVATVVADPPLSGLQVPASVPLVEGGCGDWRAALRADFAAAQRWQLAGNYASACGEKNWPVAYADPRSYNARLVEAMWREMGGRLRGRVRDGLAPNGGATPAFEFESPALAEVIRDMNKFSNNVMARQIFLTLGLAQRGSGTPEAARDVVGEQLQRQAGCAPSEFRLDNGSGLSRVERLSARCLAQVLQWGWRSPWMPELLSSLPIAGQEATARRARAAVGRAHLKTGSLEGVAAIAGVVHAPSGRRYVVVGLVNHANAAQSRPALDALVRWTFDEENP